MKKYVELSDRIKSESCFGIAVDIFIAMVKSDSEDVDDGPDYRSYDNFYDDEEDEFGNKRIFAGLLRRMIHYSAESFNQEQSDLIQIHPIVPVTFFDEDINRKVAVYYHPVIMSTVRREFESTDNWRVKVAALTAIQTSDHKPKSVKYVYATTPLLSY